MASATFKQLTKLRLEKEAECVVLSEIDSTLFVVSSPGKEISIYGRVDPEKDEYELKFRHTILFPAQCLQFSNDGRILGIGTMQGSVIWLNLEKEKEGKRGGVVQLCQHIVNREMWAAADLHSNIRILDSRECTTVASYQLKTKRINSLRYSPDGELLAVGTEDCQLLVVTANNGDVFANFVGHLAPVTDVRFHPNEYLIVSCSKDKIIKFWDLESHECVSQSQPLPTTVSRMLFEPEGNCLFVSTCKGIRVLGWEPSRVFCHLTPETTVIADWSPPVVMGNQPIEDRLISLCLSEDKKSVALFAVDIEELRPFLLSPDESPRIEFLPTLPPANQDYDPTHTPPPAAEQKNPADDRPHATVCSSALLSLVPLARPQQPSNSTPNTPNMSRNGMRKSFTKKLPDTVPAVTPPGTVEPTPPVEPTAELAAFVPRPKLCRSPPPRLSRSDSGREEHYLPRSPSTPTNSSGGSIPPNNPPMASNSTIYIQLPSPEASSGAFPVTRAAPPPINTITKTSNKKNGGNISPSSGRKPSNTRDRDIPSKGSKPHTKSVAKVSPQPAGRRPQGPTNTHRGAGRGDVNIAPFGKPSPVQAYPSNDNVSCGGTYNIHPNSSYQGAGLMKPPMEMGFGETYEIPREDSIFNNASPAGKHSDDYLSLPAQLSGSLGLSSPGLHPSAGSLRFGNGVGVGVSEESCLDLLSKESTFTRAVLEHRVKHLQCIQRVWSRDGTRRAVEVAVSTNDQSVHIEILRILNSKSNLWTLELCTLLLPCVRSLLMGMGNQRPREAYVETAVSSLKLIVSGFGNVIKHGLARPSSIGTDLEGDARIARCKSCLNELVAIRNGLTDRHKLGDPHPSASTVKSYREVAVLLQILDG